MRPVRFVALSEDGHAFVLADEVGRLLALPIDDRITTAVRADRAAPGAGQMPVLVVLVTAGFTVRFSVAIESQPAELTNVAV